MDPLHIYLFGGFLLERGNVALPPIASRVGRSLFAFMVMHRGRPLQRDYLAGIFWPDLPESRARRRLSHTLWQIQDVVNVDGMSYLDITSDTMAFNESTTYWLDVAAFDQSFTSRHQEPIKNSGQDASRLRDCVELYRGDFLAGYFDDWVLVEQDHYRQRYLVALRRLIDATKSNGAYEEALAFARRLTHHDPLSEEAHQEVMRLNFLLGRTTEAIDQFERCKSVLEEELGTEPSAPTIEIYEKIMRQRRSGVRPLREDERAVMLGRRADTPFVGREQERRLLIDSFERVLSGTGGVVLVEGEPGVGKTRTTLEAAEDARWRGFEVSWGSCRPGALRPFAPIVEVLESLSPLRIEQLTEQVSPVWLGEIARLIPAMASRIGVETSAQLRPAEESTRMIESLVHTLSALGRIAPHLVIIDDVHWADQDTLSVLTQVGSRLADSRVLLMLLYRSEEARGDAEVWDVMRGLDRTSGLGRVVLSPLSVFELEEMVRRVLGTSRLESTVATRLHRQTGGNVLFTLETLLSMRDRGLFESGADPATVLERQMDDDAIPVAPRVRSVIESRISLLRGEVTTVYELAAITGDRIDLALVEQATGLSRATVLAAVDELLYRGLFVDDGLGNYRIAHDQIRQVVYDDIDPTTRRTLHLRVAEALAEIDSEDVEVIGHHFRQAGEPARATDYLERAGLRALDLNAYATARSHLLAAFETASASTAGQMRRYELLAHLDDVLGVLGRRDEQQEIIAEMSVIADTEAQLHGDLWRRRAWFLAQSGELQQAEESAERSVGIEREHEDRRGISQSLVALGTVRRWSGRPLEAAPTLREAVQFAVEDADRADALTELASTLVEVQEVDDAMGHLASARAIYEAAGDLRGQAEVAGIEARVLHRHGGKDQAIRRYEQTIQLCHRIGYRHGEGVNLTNLANLQQLLGSVADAIDGYDHAARIFADLGNRRGEAMVLANSASARHNLLGEDDRARTDALTALRHFTAIGDKPGQAQCREILASIEDRSGRHGEARHLIETGLSDLADSGNTVLQVQLLRTLAALDLSQGDVDMAAAIIDEAQGLAEASGLRDLSVELTSMSGMAALQAGKVDQALALTRQAAESVLPGVERPFLIHDRHAIAATSAGRHDEARSASLSADQLLRDALAGLSADELRCALSRVPEHERIATRAAEFGPRVVEVSLPSIDAPTGRPLENEDLRLVSWTVEHPDDDRQPNEIQRRRFRLVRLLEEAERRGATATTEHLAAVLGVSSSTVRRDLDALRANGHSLRTRGQRKAG